MKNIKDRENFIIREDSFDIAFANYFYGHSKRINNILNEKNHRLDSSDVSYRVITHWEKMGLLTSDRPEGTSWRKYSILDIVWVQIISELRKFGFSIDKILIVKENITSKYDSISPFPELEFFVAFAFNKVPSFLVVFNNGEAIACTLSDIQLAKRLGTIGNCIILSINDILEKLYPEKDLKPDFNSNFNLSKDEVELLAVIRLNDWIEIKIKGKNGKIEMIERTENNTEENRIIEIIKSEDYQDIQLKTAKGKILYVKRTIKQKIK